MTTNTICAQALALEADELARKFREALTAQSNAGWVRGIGSTDEAMLAASVQAGELTVAAWRAFYSYTSHVAEVAGR